MWCCLQKLQVMFTGVTFYPPCSCYTSWQSSSSCLFTLNTLSVWLLTYKYRILIIKDTKESTIWSWKIVKLVWESVNPWTLKMMLSFASVATLWKKQTFIQCPQFVKYCIHLSLMIIQLFICVHPVIQAAMYIIACTVYILCSDGTRGEHADCYCYQTKWIYHCLLWYYRVLLHVHWYGWSYVMFSRGAMHCYNYYKTLTSLMVCVSTCVTWAVHGANKSENCLHCICCLLFVFLEKNLWLWCENI